MIFLGRYNNDYNQKVITCYKISATYYIT